ncbi:hypothetical protein NKH77_24260 [Streptomyces sp. M19]
MGRRASRPGKTPGGGSTAGGAQGDDKNTPPKGQQQQSEGTPSGSPSSQTGGDAIVDGSQNSGH